MSSTLTTSPTIKDTKMCDSPSTQISKNAVDKLNGPFIVIGGGENHELDDLQQAYKQALDLRNVGWWVCVVDKPSKTLIAEYGLVTDSPKQSDS